MSGTIFKVFSISIKVGLWNIISYSWDFEISTNGWNGTIFW